MANSSSASGGSASGGSASRDPASGPGRSHHPLAPRAAASADPALDSRRVTARGVITTAAEQGKILVEAEGTFVGLRPEQAARLFGGVHPDATDPTVAHD